MLGSVVVIIAWCGSVLLLCVRPHIVCATVHACAAKLLCVATGGINSFSLCQCVRSD